MPVGPYDNGRRRERSRNRSISRRLGRLSRNMLPSRRGRTPKQPFTDQFVERGHESPNRWQPKRQGRRWQKLLCQTDERACRALFWRLVGQPPQENREVDEIEKTAESVRHRRLWRIRCSCHGILEDLLHAHSRERRAFREDAIIGVADQDRDERT